MKTITLGFSPCPNDTFIFDALVNKRIETGNYIFEPVLEDVEALNKKAFEQKLDVTKISIGAYAGASAGYIILDAGSALGKGTGPVLVSKKPVAEKDFSNLKIAIPGKFTTANLLLSFLYPAITNKTEILFSEIESQVIEEKVDAGLLIHEGRFTYEKRGLLQLSDLGEVWESKMHVPLPLGCIAASRKLSSIECTELSNLIRSSIEYAYKNPSAGEAYIRQHAHEMEPEIIARHIALYVNNFSLTLGREGREAIAFLLKKGMESGFLTQVTQPIFNTDSI